MAATYTEQYRAATSLQASTDDALSVRHARELERGANNYKGHVAVFKTLQAIFPPQARLTSPDSSTTETVKGIWVGREIGDGFSAVRCTIGHCRSAGTSTTTWRLYCCRQLYIGTDAFSSSYLGKFYQSNDSLVTDSDTHAVTPSSNLTIERDTAGLSWFVLTAENGDASTSSYLTSIDIWPVPLT